MTEHIILTEQCHPICLPNIQIQKHWESEIDNEVRRLLKTGVIRHSNSPWGARVVPVKKKTEEIRMCVDYRRLNEVKKKDSYPLPRITEIQDELEKAKIFSTLDATSSYHQIAVHEEYKPKDSV